MKKLLATLLTMALCLSFVPAYAANEDVSISFSLGESTLMINGNPVEVEKPFATGAGTTLVPLRVITEAFGATVEWVQEEQKIILTYPDVNIVLQINNRYAEINAHTEELPEAPVLSENGVTMVPLRFISDTYGADVVWDDGLITVTKKADTEYGEMVQGMADSDKIGDSYYGWVMNNPKSMVMSERDFDGSYISFTNDAEDFIDIYVYEIDADTPSYETYYNSVKNLVSGGVLIQEDKLTDANGNKYFVVQGKKENDYFYSRCYYTRDKVYELMAAVTAETKEKHNEFLAIVDSFAVASLTEDVYDLSDVTENGTRKFTDDKYKVSIEVPADFYQSEGNENVFTFISPDEYSNNVVQVAVYSKTDKHTALSFAENDSASKRKYLNADLTKVSDVVTEEINGATVYSYTTTTSGSVGMDAVEADYFLENGDYIYNCTISAKTEEDADVIFNTLKTEALDTNEIGSLLRGYGDNEENITIKAGDWSFDMPGNWTSADATESGVAITNQQSVIMLLVIPNAGAYTTGEFMQEIISQQTSSSNIKQIGNTKTVSVNNRTYTTAVLKETTDGKVYYTTVYMVKINGKIMTFMLMESELFNGAGSYDDLMRVLSSLQVK